jgi:hypothetical protein
MKSSNDSITDDGTTVELSTKSKEHPRICEIVKDSVLFTTSCDWLNCFDNWWSVDGCSQSLASLDDATNTND